MPLFLLSCNEITCCNDIMQRGNIDKCRQWIRIRNGNLFERNKISFINARSYISGSKNFPQLNFSSANEVCSNKEL